MFRDKIEAGTEYYESLMQFIKDEETSGNVTLSLFRQLVLLRCVSALALVVSGAALVTSAQAFIGDGNQLMMNSMFGSAVACVASSVFRHGVPGGMYSKFATIKAPFNWSSLNRLVSTGAPNDVVMEVIALLRKRDSISYAELYDAYWLSSRRASGIEPGVLIMQKYSQLRGRQLATARKIF